MKDHGTKRKKEMGNDKLKTKSRCKIEATWDETLLSSEELGGEHHKAGIALIVIHDGAIDQICTSYNKTHGSNSKEGLHLTISMT